MTNRRRFLTASAASVAAVLAGSTTGTGGNDQETTTTAQATETTGSAATTTDSMDGNATVAVRSTDEYGDVLVDSEGLSLYLFTEDEGSTSTCYDGCADNWPPLTVDGEPTAVSGVTATLGTTERDDGSTQVTAAGKPLYYFAGDSAPGDTNGQGVGGVWLLLAPDGSQIGGTDSTTTTTDDAGGGY